MFIVHTNILKFIYFHHVLKRKKYVISICADRHIGQCHDIRIKHHVYDAAKLIILELNASTSSFSSERQSVTKTGLITENKLHVYIYNYI